MKVFGIGHVCVDYLAVLEPYPRKGKKGTIVQSEIITGGPVPTALCALANWGLEAVFCGKVGDDPHGAQVLRELAEAGVDTAPVVVAKGERTPRAYIWIDRRNGVRTVALDTTGSTPIGPREADLSHLRGCRVLLCDGRAADTTIIALRTARRQGIITVLDAGAVRPRFTEILKLTDYAAVSSDLADTFAPGASPLELARLLVRSGARNAVVTCGRRGAVWCGEVGTGKVGGYRVRAVDTTGAGDVFHAGVVFGLLTNMGWKTTLRFAVIAAALSCRRLSGLMGIPRLSEVQSVAGR